MSGFRRVWAGGSALALLMLGTSLVDNAAAANPGCGDTISSSTTLTADVGPCNAGDGLVVTGSTLTLNLNGHRVFANAPFPRNAGVDANGLYLPADVVGVHVVNAHNVSVINGTVEGFSAGVAIEEGGGNTVKGVTAQNNHAPCIGEAFTTQSVGTYGDGIVIFSSVNNRIVSNTVRNNGPFDGIGIVATTEMADIPQLPLPSGNVVQANSVADHNECSAEMGIRVEGPGATRSIVSNNKVTNTNSEGIGVLAAVTIDFRGAFSPQPTCQNRGFPSTHLANFTAGSPVVTFTQGTVSAADVGKTITSFDFPGPGVPDNTLIVSVQSPTQATIAVNAMTTFNGARVSLLPQCPLLNPLNPTNDNNIIRSNNVQRAGVGGTQTPAGPGLPIRNSAQSRSGIALVSFCGFGVRNGSGNTIQANTTTFNGGDGITVGGCPALRPPGTFPGWTSNKILGNTSLNNGQTATAPRFDLHDTNANCDANTWFGNVYRTASPACTTTGGRMAAPGTAGAAPSAAGQGAATAPAPRVARSGRYIG